MEKIKYYLTNVFTDKRFGGNPLAVFPDAQRIPENLYQKIARDMNLSESTFILPTSLPGCDFALRIFTPSAELPMAGHPTIGTAFAVRHFQLADIPKNQVMIEEKIGPIEVHFTEVHEKPMTWMKQPLPHFADIPSRAAGLAALLSLELSDIDTALPASIASFDNPFVTLVPVKTLAAMKRAEIRMEIYNRWMQETGARCIFPYTMETQEANSTIHCRMFAPSLGITEDPATGSAAGPLGVLLAKHGIIKAESVSVVEQGYEMGRPSQLYVQVKETNSQVTEVHVGGECVLTGEGYLYI